jgi:hypothetical protein
VPWDLTLLHQRSLQQVRRPPLVSRSTLPYACYAPGSRLQVELVESIPSHQSVRPSQEAMVRNLDRRTKRIYVPTCKLVSKLCWVKWQLAQLMARDMDECSVTVQNLLQLADRDSFTGQSQSACPRVRSSYGYPPAEIGPSQFPTRDDATRTSETELQRPFPFRRVGVHCMHT